MTGTGDSSRPSSQPPKTAAEALANMERPQVKWQVIAQIGGAFVILWVTALMLQPYVGYWGVGVVGVLTLAALGFGIYIYRWTRKSQAIVDIMKGATDAQGRQRALEQLASGDSKDALNALARAQILAQTDPSEAMKVLESVDLEKAPALVQDDVRSQLGLLYLRVNRVRDARALADDIRLDRQSNSKAKAMYAAIVAESFARTGKLDEAKNLLDTYKADDPEYGEIAALLLRAQVYTYLGLKKRGLAKKAMEGMAAIEPNLLGAFVQKGTAPELSKLAKEVLAGAGAIPRVKFRMK